MPTLLIVPPLAVLEAAVGNEDVTFTLQPKEGPARQIIGAVTKVERYTTVGDPMKRKSFRRVTIVLEFPGFATFEVDLAAPTTGGEATIERAILLLDQITPAGLFALLPPAPEPAEIFIPQELLSRRVEEVPELKPFLPILRRSGVVYVGEACMIPVRRGGRGDGPNVGMRLRTALVAIGIPREYHPTRKGPDAWRPPYWDDPTLADKLRLRAIDSVVLDEDDVPDRPWYQELITMKTGEWIVNVRKNRIRHGTPEIVDALGWSFDRLQRVQSKLKPECGLHAAMLMPPDGKAT